MKKNIQFYLFSFFTIFFQFIFLSLLKEFDKEMIKYIEINTVTQIIVSCLGTIQFYIKKKNKDILLKINKKLFNTLLIVAVFLGFYYLQEQIVIFILFLTTLISSISIILCLAIYSRFNQQKFNTYYLFFLVLIKNFILYIFYIYSFNFYYGIILVNLLSSVTILFFKLHILFSKDGFSFLSVFNNLLGTSLTTIDKLYCNIFLSNLSVLYFIFFRIGSVFQTLSEIIFRKERFEITSGMKRINKKYLNIKLLLMIIFMLFVYLILKNFVSLTSLDFIKNTKFQFIYSLLNKSQEYALEITMISLGFIINSLSSLMYDFLYKSNLKKYLVIVNLLNFFIFIFFLFNSLSLHQLSISFLAIQIINLLFISICYRINRIHL